MRIDVWADVICPWCHLGHRRLAAALRLAGADDVEVHWRAFQLDPGAPRPSEPMAAALEARHGPGAVASMAARLGGLGREVGIEFDLAAARRFDTFDVHRLLAWGRSQPALRADLLDRCFRGALELGEDLGDHAVLVGLVTELGGDAAVAAEVLSGDDFATEVRVDLDAARELGISGVPAFVFDASFVVPGAQDADRLAALIERLRARAAGTR